MSDAMLSRLDDCTDEVCITCGDVALEMTVVSVDGAEARCELGSGASELVAVELVSRLVPGDRVLVHAGVALTKLERKDITP